VFVTAIYYLDLNIIGRSSGRSAVGASAYRRGEKMQSTAHAAYQRGEKIINEGDGVTHDYRAKGGVEHSEILLPNGAPPQYNDAQTLWNAVEARETHKSARLAREIIVALPREFDLQEQIDLVREYAKENFVDKGLGVDFSIHDKKDGNPHAHIMFTTRYITPEGLGRKDRDLDKESELMEWRKSWAEVTNRKFVEKGLDERIDHRSYKEQGIDREPTIHLGHEAWALEKKGIQTAKGDYNREIQRRNAERETQKTKQNQEITAQTYDLNAPKNNHGDAERRALMSAKHSMSEIEEHLKAEKATQIAENLQQQRATREETEKIAEYMNELRENYIELDKELRILKEARDEANYHIPSLAWRAESIDEQTKNIGTLQSRLSNLQAGRKKLHFWEKQLKEDTDRKIERIEHEVIAARAHFKVRYGIEPEQAPEEIERIQEKIKALTNNHNQVERIPELSKKLDDIEKEYHKQKLLTKLRPDNEQIDKLLEQGRKPPESVRERLNYERINRRLNTITEHNIEDIIRDCERQNTQMVRDLMSRYREEQQRIREKERERERIRERNRNRTITRSR